jgi:hypothetical protein
MRRPRSIRPGLPGSERLDRIERLDDGLCPPHADDVFREAGGFEMRVGIDQPGNDSLAGQVENTRPCADGGFDRRAAACRKYRAIPNGQRLHNG